MLQTNDAVAKKLLQKSITNGIFLGWLLDYIVRTFIYLCHACERHDQMEMKSDIFKNEYAR